MAAALENILLLTLEDGPVTIELLPDLAPAHVARIKELAREGFYDGVVFHRVIPGFMAQGGDPTGTGSGGSNKPNLPAEFSREPHVRGVCSMARTSNPNSANSQFFICFADATFLDGQYTVWGRVTEGMAHIDALPKGEPPRAPGKIVSMKVAADQAKPKAGAPKSAAKPKAKAPAAKKPAAKKPARAKPSK
jgi:peptidylprolyl isomerase